MVSSLSPKRVGGNLPALAGRVPDKGIPAVMKYLDRAREVYPEEQVDSNVLLHALLIAATDKDDERLGI